MSLRISSTLFWRRLHDEVLTSAEAEFAGLDDRAGSEPALPAASPLHRLGGGGLERLVASRQLRELGAERRPLGAGRPPAHGPKRSAPRASSGPPQSSDASSFP